MIVARSLAEIPGTLRPSVVTIGKFNAVHRGHVDMIAKARAFARERGLHAIVVTFDRHPVALFDPEKAPPDITGVRRRMELIEATGIDACLVLPFTKEFASLTPEEFAQQVLVDGLGATCVVVGRDFRYGRQARGNVDTLRSSGDSLGFEVVEVDDVKDDASDDRISSSHVRRLLFTGDVEAAARALGRPHAMQGEIVHGEKKGREFGFPTANLSPNATGMMPGDGVYAGWLITPDGTRFPAAVSVGTNPTIEGKRARVVEAHCLTPPGDLYGQVVVVEFVSYIRGMFKFDSLDELIWQMGHDVDIVRERLGLSV